ncbi:calcium-binding protein [Rhizobium sp. FKL33]|uniref:calcium-binding protein n=1 Tax=Rhizobium sp. FKL33 TaxID=2562307 RepID=UPI0010C0FE42|nr:calcium-binding protein [Rhizobium sp. FKL33]
MIKVTIGAKAGNYDFDLSSIDMDEIWDTEAYRPEIIIDSPGKTTFTGTVILESRDDDASLEIEGEFSVKAMKNKDYENLLVSATSLTVIEGGVESYTISGLDLSADDIASNKSLAAYLKSQTVQIVGNDKDNELTGSAGKEAFVGGNGDDVYYVTSKDTVTEGSGKSSGNDTVVGSGELDLADYKNVENLTGGKSNDDLTGNSGANVLNGGAGNDILDGDGGKDVLIGGAGNDTYYVTGSETIKEAAGKAGGVDTVIGSGVISLAKFENIENLEGDRKNDTLTGNSGDNMIDGGKGADKMTGGAGDDTYIVDNAKDSVVESDKKGHDTVETSVSFSLEKFKLVEDLFLVGKDDLDAIGNAEDNVIEGNSGDNIIEGALGDDELSGESGVDTFVFSKGDGEDTITDFVAKKGAQHEVIELEGFGRKFDYDDLKFIGSKAGVEIDFGKGDDSIFLEGVKMKDLDASDFQF